MGFITQLGKGFIRSAVNQVGRDGGKVISNSLYGDAHSTPIRRAGQAYAEQPQRLPPSTKEGEYDDDTKRVERHYLRDGCFSGCLGAFVFIIGTAIFTSYLGGGLSSSLCLLIAGYLLYRGTDNIVYTRHARREATYTQDRRYKTGQRYTGDVLVTHKTYHAPTTEEIRKYRRGAIVYVLAAAFFLWAGFSQRDTPVTNSAREAPTADTITADYKF